MTCYTTLKLILGCNLQINPYYTHNTSTWQSINFRSTEICLLSITYYNHYSLRKTQASLHARLHDICVWFISKSWVQEEHGLPTVTCGQEYVFKILFQKKAEWISFRLGLKSCYKEGLPLNGVLYHIPSSCITCTQYIYQSQCH